MRQCANSLIRHSSMPPLPPTPPLPSKVKRNVIIFFVLVIACTFTLAYLLIAAIAPTARTSVQNASSGGYALAGRAVDSIGMAASIRETAAMDEGNGYAMEEKAAPSPSLAPSAAPQAPAADTNTGTTQQRIIRNGSLALRVQDAPGALEQAKSIAEGKGGFVQSSSINDSGSGPRTAYATIRVPVAAFGSAIADLKKLAIVVLTESTNASDVTMQYTDLESNLRNARAEEESYLELLKRTGSMNDVLLVTRQLAQVRGRIEQLEGQKRYMESQTDDATITLTLTEEARVEVPTRTWKPLEVIREAFRELVVSLQGLVDVLIRLAIGFIGLFIPIALITAFFIWLGWRFLTWLGRRIIKPRM